MSAISLLQSTAYVPSLASRPFLAAFIIALIARLEIVLPLGQAPPTAPTWFVSNWFLGITAVLALAEVWATKDPSLRSFLNEVGGWVKIIVTFVITFALVDAESSALLGTLAGDPSTATAVGAGWSGLMSATTWGIASIRRGFYRVFSDLDEADDLGAQGLFAWLEDFMAVFGVLLATVFPIVAILLFGATIFGLFLFQKWVDRQEEKKRLACSQCNQSIYMAAASCHHCGSLNNSAHRVGVLGQTQKQLARNLSQHKINLLSRKRCSVCATRLRQKSVRQTCPTCRQDNFASAQELDAYLAHLEPSLWKTTAILIPLSFIPLVGLVPGIVYYRLSLVASLRRYVPNSIGCFTRWGIRLLNLLLIALQAIPILGALVLPLMCLTNYYIYLRIIQREGQKKFGETSQYKLGRSTALKLGEV